MEESGCCSNRPIIGKPSDCPNLSNAHAVASCILGLLSLRAVVRAGIALRSPSLPRAIAALTRTSCSGLWGAGGYGSVLRGGSSILGGKDKAYGFEVGGT